MAEADTCTPSPVDDIAEVEKHMLDRLINLEIRTLLSSEWYVDVLITTVASVLLMILLFQLQDKEWLIFFCGTLIVWERVLVLKIRDLKGSKKR